MEIRKHHEVYLFIAVLCAIGCGESVQSLRNRAVSQVNVIADNLSKKVDKNGFIQEDVKQIDPWGNLIRINYGKNSLSVVSNGQDGLPFTRDDITARCQLDHKSIEDIVDGVSHSVSHGLTKGIIDAFKETRKRE